MKRGRKTTVYRNRRKKEMRQKLAVNKIADSRGYYRSEGK
jgi:hypothetical protein